MGPKNKEKVVVLLSGGIDSAVTLHLTLKYGFSSHALIFDYGQRHRREIDFAVANAEKCAAPYRIVKIDLGWGGSALTDKNLKLAQEGMTKGVPATYVPARNIIFLSFAVSLAETISAKKVFIGAHIQDYSGYPDCRPEFLTSFQNAANLGISKRGIEIVAPLLHKKKADIIRTGDSLGVDFRHTWSCYQGDASPCGRCDSCRYRAKGFKEAKIHDPLLEPQAKK
ncbi:7-cyano-7-deazaguanine synthase QueC [Candidatus Omnitrophota bacterium]